MNVSELVDETAGEKGNVTVTLTLTGPAVLSAGLVTVQFVLLVQFTLVAAIKVGPNCTVVLFGLKFEPVIRTVVPPRVEPLVRLSDEMTGGPT